MWEAKNTGVLILSGLALEVKNAPHLQIRSSSMRVLVSSGLALEDMNGLKVLNNHLFCFSTCQSVDSVDSVDFTLTGSNRNGEQIKKRI